MNLPSQSSKSSTYTLISQCQLLQLKFMKAALVLFGTRSRPFSLERFRLLLVRDERRVR